MSLHWAGELRKYEGYVRIGWKGSGVIEFEQNTPSEVIDAFWKMWPKYRAEVIALQRSGNWRSSYPILPEVDPNENRIHYGAPLIYKVNQFSKMFCDLKTSEEAYQIYKSIDQDQLSEYEKDELTTSYHEAFYPLFVIETERRLGRKTMEYQDFMKRYNDLTHWFLCRFPGKNRNIVFSPYSILTVLLILADATAGTTRQEILHALYERSQMQQGFPEQMKVVREELIRKRNILANISKNDILAEIFADRSENFHTANALCIRKDYACSIHSAFRDTLRELYDGELFSSEETLSSVENWAKKRMPEIQPVLMDMRNSESVLSLINAVSFDAMWSEPYAERNVKKKRFHNSDQTESIVNMLHSTEKQYIENTLATGFVKHFQFCNFSFMALLPRKKGPEALDELAGTVNFTELLESRYRCIVHTMIPEFSFDFLQDLKDIFEWLGIRDIYKIGSNFSPLSSEHVFVDKIEHRAKIDLNRKGVRVGAVTYVQMFGAAPLPKEEKYVLIDRPFVFAILNEELNLPIFAGIVNHVDAVEE